jgi:hypothetical protein
MPPETPSAQIKDMFDRAVDTDSGVTRQAFVKAFLTVGASRAVCAHARLRARVCPSADALFPPLVTLYPRFALYLACSLPRSP